MKAQPGTYTLDEGREKAISAKITPSLKRDLEAIAAEEHRTLSSAVALLLEYAIGEYAKSESLKKMLRGKRHHG